MRHILISWFDRRNKGARAINMVAVVIIPMGLAFASLPVRDTTPAPTRAGKVEKVAPPKATFEKKILKRSTKCDAALDELAVQCRIQKTKEACNAWLSSSNECSKQ